MIDLKLIRKNITAQTVENFGFDVEGFEFLVCNFNDFDIYVAFTNTSDTSKMMKIPANTSRICLINKNSTVDNYSKNVYVYAESSGEVEVQCIRF